MASDLLRHSRLTCCEQLCRLCVSRDVGGADQRCERDTARSAVFNAEEREDVTSQRKDVSTYRFVVMQARRLGDAIIGGSCLPDCDAYIASCFSVEDIEDVVAPLRAFGAELVGQLVQYETSYRLC